MSCDTCTCTRAIEEIIGQLGEYERKILMVFAARLAAGRREYGEWLPNDGRQMESEIFEELIDQAVYSSVRLLELKRGGT